MREFRQRSRILTCNVTPLKRAGCEKIIEDTVSGGKVQRPGQESLDDRLRSGDVPTAWRLDPSCAEGIGVERFRESFDLNEIAPDCERRI